VAMLVAVACQGQSPKSVATMTLTLPTIGADGPIPKRFTCDGADRSPALEWSEPPAGTRSLAIFVDDPDAPGGNFAHWSVFHLAPSARRLAEGAGEVANRTIRQARNDFGTTGYNGPCPPHGGGPHHYRFRLFALDVAQLALGPSPTIAEVEQATDGHVMGEATVTASYARE
jgi:hypothetical protein